MVSGDNLQTLSAWATWWLPAGYGSWRQEKKPPNVLVSLTVANNSYPPLPGSNPKTLSGPWWMMPFTINGTYLGECKEENKGWNAKMLSRNLRSYGSQQYTGPGPVGQHDLSRLAVKDQPTRSKQNRKISLEACLDTRHFFVIPHLHDCSYLTKVLKLFLGYKKLNFF